MLYNAFMKTYFYKILKYNYNKNYVMRISILGIYKYSMRISVLVFCYIIILKLSVLKQ